MTRKLLIFRRKIAQLRPRPIFVRVKLFPGRLKFGGMILSWAVLWLCSPVSGRLKLFNRCWTGAGVGASVGGGKQAAMGTHQQQQHHNTTAATAVAVFPLHTLTTAATPHELLTNLREVPQQFGQQRFLYCVLIDSFASASKHCKIREGC